MLPLALLPDFLIHSTFITALCEITDHGCSDICEVDAAGEIICVCPEGLVLGADKKTCGKIL